MKRGPAYWTCRVFVLIARVGLLFVFGELALFGVYIVHALPVSPTWHSAMYWALAAIAAIGFGCGVRTAWRTVTTTMSPAEWQSAQLASQSRYRWLPVGVQPVVVLLALPVTGPFFLGFALAWLPGVSLGRELPAERGARLDLERQRRENAEREEKFAARLGAAHGGVSRTALSNGVDHDLDGHYSADVPYRPWRSPWAELRLVVVSYFCYFCLLSCFELVVLLLNTEHAPALRAPGIVGYVLLLLAGCAQAVRDSGQSLWQRLRRARADFRQRLGLLPCGSALQALWALLQVAPTVALLPLWLPFLLGRSTIIGTRQALVPVRAAHRPHRV